MSKILLIESNKMLQHAFVLALFPEHEVEVIHEIGAAAKDAADLAIIDAAALRDCESETEHEAPGGEWHLPTIRIGGLTPISSDSSEVVVLAMPFTKDELRAAIAQVLRPTPSHPAHHPEDAQRDTRKSKPLKATPRKQEPDDRQVIELVDVFVEGEDPRRGAGVSSTD